ncbi:HNH endonuclease [Nocardioides sp. URHA0020]|uniref:HNH endonuclease n=1 Tax=Nocardioides sp. URHA0020 TaxID=1380392 RepID=UPI001E36242F|nr:HNH endonuclease [Nocardioides sp. URHA0020]
MCHAHHWTRWADGGPSDLDNAGLLCPRHHARAHDPTYAMAKHHNGKVTFTRRQ